MTTLRENFFVAGVAIMDQLKSQCGETFKRYDYAPSIAALAKLLSGVFPAAFVIPGPLATGVDPRQTWYVAIYVRNVEGGPAAAGLMSEAGALVSAVMIALARFVPGDEFGPLYIPDEQHLFPDIGQGVFGLTYTTQIEPEFWPFG